nr:IS3 family transposase [Marinomonas balearica]
MRIRECHIASGGTYSNRWIHRNFRDEGEPCSPHPVARIMRNNNIKAQIGYKGRHIQGCKVGTIADNILKHQLNPDSPNKAWVSGITYLKTHEGLPHEVLVHCDQGS